MKDLYNLKVASIESPTRIVLNAGALDGVNNGMTFVIFEIGGEVFDPDTHESLGNLEIVRGNVEVIHTQEKMCLCQSNDFITEPFVNTVNALGITGRILSAGGKSAPTEERKVIKRLNSVKIGQIARRTS